MFWLPRSILLTSQRVYLRHNRHVARTKINGQFHLSFCGLIFEQNSGKITQSDSHDVNVHCEICAYSRFCETKELKGENNSVLRSLFSLPPTTYWWASSCILGNQWLKRFHGVSAWLRVIWQIYELCRTGRHSARCGGPGPLIFRPNGGPRADIFYSFFLLLFFARKYPAKKILTLEKVGKKILHRCIPEVWKNKFLPSPSPPQRQMVRS